MKATRTSSVRWATLGGAVALAIVGHVGLAAVISAGPAAAAGTITQSTPTNGSVKYGHSFTDQLQTSGNIGPVTFATDSATTWGTVSSTGLVSIADTALPRTYILFGTDADSSGDTGVWQYQLTVTYTVGPLTLTGPTSGSVPTSTSSAFTDQLNVTGNIGPVTFSGSGAGLTVSSSGQIATTGTLLDGIYTATGTMADAYFDKGSFTYTLAVGVITQTGPTSGSVPVTTSSTFTDQLDATGGIGAITFTGGGTGLTVSSTGQITTAGTLAAGTYTATGTTADAFGDAGTFTYTLTVGTITLIAPTGTVTTSESAAFTDQLSTTGNDGPVTFTGGGTDLAVSSSGQITTTGTLAAASYTASGTVADAFGDAGPFTYTLTVDPVNIAQTGHVAGSVTALVPFTDQLATIANIGTVTFTTTSATPAFTVSASGAVAAPGTLPVGNYTVSGTDTDAYGDSGIWTYTLTVTPAGLTITQTSPTTGSVTTTGSAAFTDQFTATGGVGAVTFTGGGTGLTISSGGQITTTGTLAAGSYTASGTVADAFGDTGKLSYTLSVNRVIITQTAPLTGTVTALIPFTVPLVTVGNIGAVTFTTTSTTPAFTVSAGGVVAAPGTLPVGSYTVSGSDTDAYGDLGSWTYTLTVTPARITIIQTAPTTGTVTTTGSAAFTDHLNTTGSVGKRSFVKTGGGTGLTVSFGGKIATTGTLAAGTYTATGTVADAFGDTGTFSYALTVKAVIIIQTAPTTGTVTTNGSAAFADHLNTTGNIGKRRFVKTGGGTGLTVSFGGKIATIGTLAAGSYTATGTVTDAFGDAGPFTYTLTVKAVTIIQTAPTTGTVTTSGSAAFTDHLNTTGSVGKRSFVKTGGGTGLKVSFGGQISTTGTLAAGTYKETGTVSDAFGDAGSFTYTLTVTG